MRFDPLLHQNQLIFWYDDKTQLSRVDTVDWKKKKKKGNSNMQSHLHICTGKKYRDIPYLFSCSSRKSGFENSIFFF